MVLFEFVMVIVFGIDIPENPAIAGIHFQDQVFPAMRLQLFGSADTTGRSFMVMRPGDA